MIKVSLTNLSFHSFHGVYEEERRIGGEYQVDLSVSFHESSLINKLDQSADYVAMFNIVKTEMDIPTPMLETIAMQIGEKLRSVFDSIHNIKVTIIKVHPPIKEMRGSAAVTWEWNETL